MDERTKFLYGDFDLLIENASHSDEFMGIRKFAQPVGTAVRWGHNCSGREQKPESTLQSWARLSGLRPTGDRLSKNGVAEFLAGKKLKIVINFEHYNRQKSGFFGMLCIPELDFYKREAPKTHRRQTLS
jgi:hypothetical protein